MNDLSFGITGDSGTHQRKENISIVEEETSQTTENA